MNEFPALYGQPVTERHAQACREHGHATYVKAGACGPCPRCGEVTCDVIGEHLHRDGWVRDRFGRWGRE